MTDRERPDERDTTVGSKSPDRATPGDESPDVSGSAATGDAPQLELLDLYRCVIRIDEGVEELRTSAIGHFVRLLNRAPTWLSVSAVLIGFLTPTAALVGGLVIDIVVAQDTAELDETRRQLADLRATADERETAMAERERQRALLRTAAFDVEIALTHLLGIATAGEYYDAIEQPEGLAGHFRGVAEQWKAAEAALRRLGDLDPSFENTRKAGLALASAVPNALAVLDNAILMAAADPSQVTDDQRRVTYGVAETLASSLHQAWHRDTDLRSLVDAGATGTALAVSWSERRRLAFETAKLNVPAHVARLQNAPPGKVDELERNARDRLDDLLRRYRNTVPTPPTESPVSDQE